MDIKDFILIGGGILICLVVAHGFWIAYRARREPYRLDIVPDLIPEDIDDMERLRGELPNGGARVVNPQMQTAEEATLDMFEDLASEDSFDFADQPVAEPLLTSGPTVGTDAPKIATSERDMAREPAQAPARRQYAKSNHRDDASDLRSDSIRSAETQPASALNPFSRKETVREAVHVSVEEQSGTSVRASEDGTPALAPDVQELLIVNVVALRGQKFSGEGLVRALRDQGLRYGEMNIFHRVNPATKLKIFSVANVVEPGVFDLSELDSLSTPGICFFLQLPGPDDALQAFESMLNAAQQVALSLGGELRDEQMSMLTGQTKEHMRQRIADFARRKLSRRA